MPIKIPERLPAYNTLEEENIFVMNEFRAEHQDIRPLKIAILNLMPTKIVTETQLMRLLSNSPLQVDVVLLQTSSHVSKNTSLDHLESFYKSFADIKSEMIDGLIITGAPVETLEFEDVDYWEELCEIMEWSRTNVHSTLYICWGAQAGLYYHYGIKKYATKQKVFGIYEHDVLNITHPLLRGFDESFLAPHSRNSTVLAEDIEKIEKLEIIASSSKAGPLLIAAKNRRRFFITGHMEYDYNTLDLEYKRDLNKGLEINMPENYYPDNNPSLPPKNRWRSHAHLLFSNWLNYFVYQETPYDINKIQKLTDK